MRVLSASFGCLLVASCAGPDTFTRFTSETPPCHLPPLSDAQVRDAVVKAGRSSQVEGLPEPIWAVTEYRCVYRYEQSAFYFKGQPVPLNTVDGEEILLVSRDGKVL
jgi:hypothetical protein